MPVQAQTPHDGAVQHSAVFNRDELVVKLTPVGKRRDVTDLPTATFERFECHISTLNPGRASHLPHTHPREEVIILEEGALEVHTNGNLRPAGPGSVFFFASNDPHAVTNIGDEPATYLVFNFATAATGKLGGKSAREMADSAKLGSTVFNWDDLEVNPTKTGERRSICDAPTTTLARFESHVTTLRAGQVSHAPHRHADEELVIVKTGEIEVTINGVAQRARPGAICFFASNDEHGLRNTGETEATYHVIRITSE